MSSSNVLDPAEAYFGQNTVSLRDVHVRTSRSREPGESTLEGRKHTLDASTDKGSLGPKSGPPTRWHIVNPKSDEGESDDA